MGHDADNFQVREIAQIVAEVYPGCELTFGPASGDNRSYRVDFAKIHAGYSRRSGSDNRHHLSAPAAL